MVASLPPRAFRELNVDEIDISDLDLRGESLDQDSLGDLGDTIKELGLLGPLLVSHDHGKQKYRLVLGRRRYAATILKGIKTCPSFIVDDLHEADSLVMMLVENMQREALHVMEEARGLALLRDRFGYDEAKTAKIVGRSVEFVEGRLALLRLPKAIQHKVEGNRIGVSQALCLTRIEGREKTQLSLAHQIEERDLPADIVERIVHESTRRKRPYRKMTRRHKVKRKGDPLTEVFTAKKIQQFVLRGEDLLRFVDGLALDRWTSLDQVKQLAGAVQAFETGFIRFKHRVEKRVLRIG